MKDNADFVYEICPVCGEEVKLKAEMKIQKCPSCGNQILPCSLCDSDECDCSNCPLECERNSSFDVFYRDSIVYKSKEYPIITLPLKWVVPEGEKNDKSCSNIEVTIADNDLLEAIEEKMYEGGSEEMSIDELIYYYCDNGFVASKPGREEIIEYFNR